MVGSQQDYNNGSPPPTAPPDEFCDAVSAAASDDDIENVIPSSVAPTLEDLEEAGLIPPPAAQNPDAEEMFECGLCFESFKNVNCCSGTVPHFLCDECFCKYAREQLDPAGAFEGQRTGGTPEESSVSQPGEMPCYLFLTGECNCAAIPATTLAKAFSTNDAILNLYDIAKRRRIEVEFERARSEADKNRAKAEACETPVQKLYQAVCAALNQGGQVACPDCKVQNQKDDACMHMVCPCGTRFCYCCGRRRGGDGAVECPSDGFGCDTPSVYLESHPGWGDFALEGETDGLGALHEFHRQRMAYFLRNVKRAHPKESWDELRQHHADIFEDVPTPGRRISWSEIDHAGPPMFGETEAKQLCWFEPAPSEDGDVGTDSDEESAMFTCCICSEPVSPPSFCSGTEPHCFCDECFCSYAKAEMGPAGAFQGERRGGEPVGGLSPPGELPCCQFVTGECDCASIPKTTIARVLSSDAEALELYEQAKRPLIAAAAERDRQDAEEAQAEAQSRETPVERLRAVVSEALSRGGHIQCPDCGVQAQKNDACMHMTCQCGRRYCYCCGRGRGNGPDECPSGGGGCDASSIYLEDNPNWGGFSQGGESAGMGALHEFHRRRMAYFVRQVKDMHAGELWEELRRDSPGILEDVPTPGRRIAWGEIDAATPPCFGETDENQLRWVDDGLRARDYVQEVPTTGNEQAGGETELSNVDKEDLFFSWMSRHNDGNRLVKIWVAGFVLTVILLCLRAAYDSLGLRVFGALCVAILSATGIPKLMLGVIDRHAANDRPNRGGLQEVQYFGRNNALPYLATGGRWHHMRLVYWILFIGSIAFGSMCIKYADASGFQNVGSFALTLVFLVYFGGAVVVNFAPEPDEGQEPDRRKYRSALRRLRMYCVLFSLGVGLLAPYDGGSTGRIAGKCLITLGVGGAVAELAPRLALAAHVDAPNSLSRAPDKHRFYLGYAFMGGISVGSLMVGLSRGTGVYGVGVATLVITFVGCFFVYVYDVKGRPYVR